MTIFRFACLALLAPPVAAAEPSPAATPDRAAYERSVGLRDAWRWHTRDVADQVQWTADGTHLTYRKTVPGGFAFVMVDPATMTRKAPFDAERLAAALGRATGTPLSPLRLPFERLERVDLHEIIVAVGERRWRCTLSDYACSPEQSGPAERPRAFGVVRDLRQPADDRPRISPDGRLEALVVDHNLVVRPRRGGTPLIVSRDGSPGNFYDPETIRWSPDSAKLALHRVRPGHARYVTRILSSPDDAVEPQVRRQLYPKPGDAVDLEQPVLFDVASGRQVPIDNTLFPNPYQLSAPEWRADGRSFAFHYQQRGHQLARLVSVDAATGSARADVTEASATFIYADRRFAHDVKGLGREIVWVSERDGWRHLYLIDARTGRVKKQITRGAWVVRDVVRIDDERRQIWFSASGRNPGEDPYYRHWYRVDFDGGNLVALTRPGATHEVTFSPDMRYFVDIRSRVDLPNIAELRDGEDGRLIATLERGDASALLAAGFRPPEPFVAKGRDGKTDIWGLVVRPRDWDPDKTYPVIENIYAGPHDSFVPKAFWPFGYHSGGDKVIGMQAQADLGFIVVQIDGMGTANRSKAFHDVAWKNLDDSGFPDRIAWMRALAARDRSVDLSRVGIYGASAGGQSALNALLFHPGFYKAAVAYAGCYDNRMDKISWNEQWLGWPVDQSYLDASGVVHAARLQGRLLLIVGEQDSNVDPASTMQVADALVKAGKDFELLVIPGGEHSAGRSTGPIDYVQRRQFDFFIRALADNGRPPAWNAAP